MAYPSTLDSIVTDTPGIHVLSAMANGGHTAWHNLESNAINALEAKVGINGSSVTTTLDYKMTNLLNGWTTDVNTWTYSATAGHNFTVTVNANITSYIGVGDRVWLTQSSTSQYFIVISLSFAAGNTTVVLYGGTNYSLTNTTITNPYYSHAKTPFGFNTNPALWTETYTDNTRRAQSSPVANTWYNQTSTTIPAGVWRVEYSFMIGPTYLTNLSDCWVCISTTNNGASTSALIGMISGYSQPEATVKQQAYLNLASATTYYINIRTTTSSVTTISIYNDIVNGYIYSICALL